MVNDPVERCGSPTFATYIRNTDPASNADMPAITVPAGLSHGLPIRLELVDYTNTDRDLLGYAAQVSTILGNPATALI